MSHWLDQGSDVTLVRELSGRISGGIPSFHHLFLYALPSVCPLIAGHHRHPADRLADCGGMTIAHPRWVLIGSRTDMADIPSSFFGL